MKGVIAAAPFLPITTLYKHHNADIYVTGLDPSLTMHILRLITTKLSSSIIFGSATFTFLEFCTLTLYASRTPYVSNGHNPYLFSLLNDNI